MDFLKDNNFQSIHKTPLHIVIKEDSMEAEIVMEWTNSRTEKSYTFTNGLENPNGGTSLTGTKTAITNFFKKNQPVSFTISHQGEREHQQFVIGNLATKQGNYRVYFLVKNNLIHQLRIEESND